jgi:hypothetical protein
MLDMPVINDIFVHLSFLSEVQGAVDWDLAIKRQRGALLGLLAVLVAGLGMSSGGMLRRGVYLAALRVLRPAEGALRRLIVIAARGVTVTERAPRPGPVGLERRTGERLASFRVIEPLKRFGVRRARICPRITVMGADSPGRAMPTVASADNPVDGRAMARRIEAVQRALDDLPGQARRLSRWIARRDRMVRAGKPPRRFSPLRPGLPPGHRQRGTHPVDEALSDCDALARRVLAAA